MMKKSPSFYVEVDYIIVVRHRMMSQQLLSSNYRQLGIALLTPPWQYLRKL
jgi:hypothetical protein